MVIIKKLVTRTEEGREVNTITYKKYITIFTSMSPITRLGAYCMSSKFLYIKGVLKKEKRKEEDRRGEGLFYLSKQLLHKEYSYILHQKK